MFKGVGESVVSKRRSSIPKVEMPRWGQAMPHARGEYRQYDSRQARRNRKLKLIATPLCERCGVVATEVHHIVPMSAGGHPSAFTNLESLCSPCHRAHHSR